MHLISVSSLLLCSPSTNFHHENIEHFDAKKKTEEKKLSLRPTRKKPEGYDDVDVSAKQRSQ